MRFEVSLVVNGPGKWAAMLTNGTMLLPATRYPRVEVARALLAYGADPRSQMVVRRGAEIIAFDTLARACGIPVVCNDAGAVEQD